MKLYVGNLPFTVQEQDLRNFFSKYSSITSVQLISDRETGRSKGFGFVEISNEDEATNAIQELNGKDFGGRAVIVNEARPRENRENRSFGGRRGR
ncbi:MAG: RNA-binding protein [Chlamydiales bacterium]|nr:RNA-binding protein [Chlamydiales bacterium]